MRPERRTIMTRTALAYAASLLVLASSPLASAQSTTKAPPVKAQAPAAKAPATPAASPAQSAAPAAPTFHVEGFRSAKFGMTPDQVRAAIAKDFNVPATAITTSQNPIDGTSAISVKLDHLDPGPGAAGVSYIFGASSKTLVFINVAWATTGAPAPEDRKAIVTAALQLTVYFQGQPWPAGRTASGALMPGNVVLMFVGVDDKGGGVEVTTAGIPLETADPKGPKIPDPTGPAQLKVAYSQNHDHPDILKIPQGSF
jgi:hypothetical protein